VPDTKAQWRYSTWQKKYVTAASDFAFYCEQSDAEMHKVAKTIQEKEEMRAKKSALRGLQDAVHNKKEAHYKKYHERDTKEAKKKAGVKEKDTKDEIRLVAKKARLKRLKGYRQAVKDLVGFVGDAMSGEGLAGVKIQSKCPFETFTTISKTNHVRKGQFLLKKGASGPLGYRCFLEFSKPGYISLPTKLILRKGATKALFRHAFLMPENTYTKGTPLPYHVVLQYGDRPADIDAHMQIYGKSQPAYDIALHRGGDALSLKFSSDGSRKAYPFVTMDAKVNTGYGPQTHTIHKPVVGKYSYYVDNYEHHFTSNRAFHQCGAQVYIYHGNTLKSRFDIRTTLGTPARFWEVFVLECTSSTSCKVRPARAFSKIRPTSISQFSG